jgi:cytochrome c oxidase subunit 3
VPTTVSEELERAALSTGGRGPGRRDGGEGDDARHRAKPPTPRSAYFTGLVLGLAAIFMFFVALASAFVVRKGLGNDWRPLELPSLLWVNTAALLASSLVVERSRRLLRTQPATGFGGWWGTGVLLGVAFLVGQVAAWRQLAAQGIFLATNPASSFFYVFTAAHGVHVLGGLVALGYVAARGAAHQQSTGNLSADLTAWYWHFLGGLWVGLLLLLTFGR